MYAGVLLYIYLGGAGDEIKLKTKLSGEIDAPTKGLICFLEFATYVVVWECRYGIVCVGGQYMLP